MAAQFTATKGPAPRSLASWIARATSSLPVPVSPRIVTVTRVGAARPAWSSAWRSIGLDPRIRRKWWPIARRSSTLSRWIASFSRRMAS